jgi:hypothetical protein
MFCFLWSPLVLRRFPTCTENGELQVARKKFTSRVKPSGKAAWSAREIERPAVLRDRETKNEPITPVRTTLTA